MNIYLLDPNLKSIAFLCKHFIDLLLFVNWSPLNYLSARFSRNITLKLKKIYLHAHNHSRFNKILNNSAYMRLHINIFILCAYIQFILYLKQLRWNANFFLNALYCAFMSDDFLRISRWMQTIIAWDYISHATLHSLTICR